MARPDAKVLTTIDGYIIKKSVNKDSIFLQAPTGECFTMPYETMQKILNEVQTNEDLKEKLGL